MGKYTNEEDRRQTVSLIVRTLLGIAVTFGLPWLNPLLAFLFYIGRGGQLPLFALDILIVIVANLILYLKFGKSDNAERTLPASIGVYLLAYLSFFVPSVFWGGFYFI